jgi:hypothetical protein
MRWKFSALKKSWAPSCVSMVRERQHRGLVGLALERVAAAATSS